MKDSNEISIDPEDHTLQYGPKTMHVITEAVEHSYKIFWDGTVSPFIDTNKSCENNKIFLKKLLEIRQNTEQDEQPPVVLIHGQETEATLRQTLTKIK